MAHSPKILKKDKDPKSKRKDYISWEDYFMGIAKLSADRSKDPACQVGACIVNVDKRIVGVGYNGMPNRCKDEELSWDKTEKHLYVCHAEMNAIMNKNLGSLEGCTIYVTRFPCNECTKLLIQSGIKMVYYLTKKEEKKVENDASEKLMELADIKCKRFVAEQKEIKLSLEA